MELVDAMLKDMEGYVLADIAQEIRRKALTYIHAAGSGHPGGSLSVADILATLYFRVARPQPYSPVADNRDIIILSKGHCCPALYAAWGILIKEGVPKPAWWGAGPIDLRKLGSAFQGHPALAHTPWCETSTGSLGQGFSVAVGMAMALKGQNRHVYCILGDGELQEGVVTEAARVSTWTDLDNLTVIIDFNRLASDQYSLLVEAIALEWSAFGWDVASCDGHNHRELVELLRRRPGSPTCIIARTVKGKGWQRAEKDPAGMHGSVTMSDSDLKEALDDLD